MSKKKHEMNGSPVPEPVAIPEGEEGGLKSFSLVEGKSALRFTSNVAWDIETMPLRSDADDGSLLDPQTARVMTIGYYEPQKDRFVICYDKDEGSMLDQFWRVFVFANAYGAKLVGFNSQGFDLPFVLKRSWFHGITVPKNIYSYGNRYCDTFVDLMQIWKGSGFKDYISLDNLARYFQVGQKTGSGEKFWKLFQTDQQAALEYLCNDVLITGRCAEHMGYMSNCA